jgi:hypothetical protein
MKAGKPWPNPTPATAGPPEGALTARLEAPPGRLDWRIGSSLRAMILCGIALALSALALGGSTAALSVAMGAALACANLWVMAKVVSALLPEDAAGAARQSRFAWALVAALKMAVLLGMMWLLMRQGFVSPLATLVGLLSLPIGIAIGSLVSDRSAPFDDR